MRLLITALACLISVSAYSQRKAMPGTMITWKRSDSGFNNRMLLQKDNIAKWDFFQPNKGYWKSNHRNGRNCWEWESITNGVRIKDLDIDANFMEITWTDNPNQGYFVSGYGSAFSINNIYDIEIGFVQSSNTSLNNNIRIRLTDHSSNILKVAVIGKESSLCDGSEDDGKELAELVEGELLGIYGVVERRHLEEILDEQRLAMSGLLLEDSDFAQAGCLAGAQGTVLASYGCLQGKTKLQIKLVDCSTSDLYWSATGFDVSEFELMDALRIELGK